MEFVTGCRPMALVLTPWPLPWYVCGQSAWMAPSSCRPGATPWSTGMGFLSVPPPSRCCTVTAMAEISCWRSADVSLRINLSRSWGSSWIPKAAPLLPSRRRSRQPPLCDSEADGGWVAAVSRSIVDCDTCTPRRARHSSMVRAGGNFPQMSGELAQGLAGSAASGIVPLRLSRRKVMARVGPAAWAGDLSCAPSDDPDLAILRWRDPLLWRRARKWGGRLAPRDWHRGPKDAEA